MPYPEKLGQPCWLPEQVRRVISLTAHTSAESAPYFLAAHSPFERIFDTKSSGRQLSEEQVFKELFSSARGEIEAFIKGEPGTGKSHLIRWLKLRADYAVEQREPGYENFTMVLVSRGNGSLKDALGQVVTQLGEKFSQHTKRISGAVDKLSDVAARDTLLSALALEVGTHWSDRHPETALPSRLQHLAAALAPTTGFGAWMKRDNGVVHRVIKRLTEASSVDEREDFPEFEPSEFLVEHSYRSPQTNSKNVTALADDLEEEEDTRELAAQTLNTALKDSIAGLTGLKSSDLLEIFNEIRRELGPKKQLAVFIEDVSVTGIDQDIINAFEPRQQDGLSRMIAVLGITNAGYDRFPDNQRQRATFVYEVGGQVAKHWASDEQAVAAFTARYLNAVRLNSSELKDVAKERFADDIASSKCDKCPQLRDCFSIFGYAELPNGVKIGLFPFNPHSPRALLSSLNDARYESQRGLLDRVVLPALDQSHAALKSNDFPSPHQFSVKSPGFKYDWAAFSARYLGGTKWTDSTKARLRFLAGYWGDAVSVIEAANQIDPFLVPLGFPIFSSEVAPLPVKPPLTEPGPHPPTVPSEEDNALKKLLGSLENWSNSSKLAQDSDFRLFVGRVLRNSIVWSDIRGTPITVSKIGSEALMTGDKYAFVRIEDQQSRPPTQTFFVDIKRSRDTKELLEALANFERRQRTWDFPHGEFHKRKLSRWLRHHTEHVVKSLCPDPPSLVTSSRKSAIQLLALASYFRDRRKMPSNAAERIECLLGPVWNEQSRPVVFSSDLRDIVLDLESKHAPLREFVIQEFGAGQGDTEPKDYIDPSPILDVLDEFITELEVIPPPVEVGQSFWKSRFSSVSRLAAYNGLRDRLEKERLAIKGAIGDAMDFTKEAGFENGEFLENFQTVLIQIIEIIGLQSGIQHRKGLLPFPNDSFDSLWQKKLIQSVDTRGSWGGSLSKAMEVCSDDNPLRLLTFDPTKLKECLSSLAIVRTYLELIDEHLEAEEGGNRPQGDSRSKLLDTLTQIESLVVTEETGPSPES